MTYKLCAFLLFWAIAYLLYGLANPPVRIAVEGGYIRTEPADIRLRVTVEPDERNRELWVGIIEPGWEDPTHSSLEELPGSSARRTRWVTFRHVMACECVAYAVIRRNDGTHDEASQRVQVLPRFGSGQF